MPNRKFFFTLILSLITLQSIAQDGHIRGTVYDDATGESIPAVSVYLEGTTIGNMTDFDGKFSIKAAPGTYNLILSFISYETIKIQGVTVKPGGVVVYDNLRLKTASLGIETVVVSHKEVRNTEVALTTMKKKSANLLDGISAASLKKTGDSDAASSMKRIPGVSVAGGKYVYVRGLGDRYTKTILNGMEIPGLDPDRNTIQMDIFPTNIVDNIIVHKSFTAQLPADFTGGVIDIELKDFPEEKKGGISLGISYNPDMHFNKDYLTYEGGKLDFLGFDDGTREIPAISNIPQFAEVIGNPDGEKAQRYREILGAFNPNLSAIKQSSFMDFNFGFDIGNQKKLKKNSIGYNFSLSYKNSTDFYKNAEFGKYGLSDPDTYEMENREYQIGNYGVNNTLISGLAGFALKTNNSKYRISLLHLQNGESTAGIFNFYGNDQGSNFDAIQHNLDYNQRSLSNILLDGKHSLKEGVWNIEWKVSPTLSKMSDPDIRFTRYEIRDDGFQIGTESGFPERIWRNLEEINLANVIHVTKKYTYNNRPGKLNFGSSFVYKQRDFIIRNFALNIRNVPLTGNPDELFYPENLWPMEGTVISGTSYEVPFVPVNPNQFNSNITNSGAYVSTEFFPMILLRLIAGIRVENYVQKYTGQDQQGYNILDNDVVLNNLDFFPTLNLVYTITEKQNLRLSWSKTIARPSFKELSYAEIYDPITGNTFIGGLFRDANDVAGIEYWNGELVSTDIQNMDLRFEKFFQKADMISLSGYYKHFTNPIEMVQFATQTGSFQPRNVGNGNVFGAEFEAKHGLEFLGSRFNNLSISVNLTLSKSIVEMSKTEYDSRIDNARTGETIEKTRVMAGQAPYLINAGIQYQGSEDSKMEGMQFGLYYNLQGQTLQYVGIVDRPDIYTNAFHSLNFNSSISLGKADKLSVGIKIDNILNDVKESVFKSFNAQDQYFSRLMQGRTFGFKLAYKFY
ncbi:MAG: TonB-dependent receptor [Bacteroidales bacterium]|nr:TonB-dependent receptor [Bacteroidales bacterium]